jgi:hypothetical protein
MTNIDQYCLAPLLLDPPMQKNNNKIQLCRKALKSSPVEPGSKQKNSAKVSQTPSLTATALCFLPPKVEVHKADSLPFELCTYYIP